MAFNLRHLTALLLSAFLLVPLGSGAGAEEATHQEADLLTFSDLEDAGEAHLVRTDDGISSRSRLSGIEPGVYTLWWVVWNAPENCDDPFACTEADLSNPDVELAIGYGGGRVVESNGRLNLAASLEEGEELTGFPTEFEFALVDSNSMANARHAEVHLVLRSHGEKIPGLVDEMLHTFQAGCKYTGPIEGTQPKYGTAGPNDCQDMFFAIFPSEDA